MFGDSSSCIDPGLLAVLIVNRIFSSVLLFLCVRVVGLCSTGIVFDWNPY